jgi:preprotein translocase subunit SecY
MRHRIGLVIMALVVFVEQCQRRIPVQYAKRMVGRRMYGGSEHLHPDQGQHGRRHPGHLRVVAALPAGARSRSSSATAARLGGLDQHAPGARRPPLYIASYFAPHRVLHVLLRAITFNPDEVAGEHEEVRRVHPRHPRRAAHREYLDYVLVRIITPGALYLGLVSLIR